MLSKIIIGLFVILIAIQFVPVNKTNPPVSQDFQTDPSVKKLFKRACYDCHSNETRWPWYSHFAPVSWYVADDVKDARSHYNFSEWDKYDTKKQQKIFDAIKEEVEDREMPLKSYRLLHHDAALTDAEILTIKQWAESQTPVKNQIDENTTLSNPPKTQ